MNLKHVTSKRLVVLATVAIFCLVVGGIIIVRPERTTVVEVEKQLQQGTPVGTARADAEKWLVGRSFDHSYLNRKDLENDSVLYENGVSADQYSGCIVSIIRGTDWDFLMTWSIQFYLVFDKEDRVAKHIVRKVGTGL